MAFKKFPTFLQLDEMDCGPTCLRIVAKHYGKSIRVQTIRDLSETTREGSSLLGLSEAAEHLGFHTLGARISLNQLEKEVPKPCIIYWQQEHFVVVYKVTYKKVYISDPASGLLTYTHEEFLQSWIGPESTAETVEGIALLLEPTPKFQAFEEDEVKEQSKGLSFLFQYLFKYKKFLIQLVLGLAAGSLLQLIFPFLTQGIVDIGIQNQDIDFIYLILFAQLFLFIGKIGLQVIRSWILLHLSTRINISLISDFFIKLMKLPISFFDVKMVGDIMQRISDHQRIEKLLTTTSLNVLFSTINIIVFGIVLAYYNLVIFFTFFLGSTIYFIWAILFLKRREKLDYKYFNQLSNENTKIFELINGMQEIKLANAEKQKRWSWEYLQARLFRVQMKSLTLEQTQSVGTSFINELTNIFITVLSARFVISGDLTLGMMLAISYIIGQLNGPILQLVSFLHSLQDAKISLERLGEIHGREDEEPAHETRISEVPFDEPIEIQDLEFRYTGSKEPVLKGITLTIPNNKITAIVGPSGSGKTTLMKMLLNFYQPSAGEIKIGNTRLKDFSQRSYRGAVGVVMQEGYIFNDSIANNIAIGADSVDRERLIHAVEMANIKDFIDTLPLRYNTQIGVEGIGMSTGQKQRLMIARAIYKDPNFLFFDEATSALDANNEKVIMNNLNKFFTDRTAVVIAHRLSTVKNADQIIVLENGKITEIGNHQSLIEQKGPYFHLVRNQLDLERLNGKTSIEEAEPVLV